MSKYHVNAKGAADVCSAHLRPCPLGGEHYATLDEAQFAAELSQLLGDKLGPKDAAPAEPLLDAAAESQRVISLINGGAPTHQMVHALVSEDQGPLGDALALLGLESLDDRQKVAMLRKLTRGYFEANHAELSALPPADVFTRGAASALSSDEEAYALTRQTLASSTDLLRRVQLLTDPEAAPRTDAERAYLAAQGEVTPEIVVNNVRQLVADFRAALQDSLIFVDLTRS